MKKKIVYIITRGDIGGAQNHLFSLIKHFSKDYDLVLISGSHGEIVLQSEDLGVTTHIIKQIDSYNIVFAIFRLARILKIESPDIVHTHSSLASVYGRISAKFCKAKVLYTVHGWHFANLSNKVNVFLQIYVEKLLRPFTDYWVTVSNFDLKLGLKYNLFKRNFFKCIENGIENKKQGDRVSSSDRIRLVFVGRISSQKNPLAAINIIEKCNENVELTMYLAGSDSSNLNYIIDSKSLTQRCQIVLNDRDPSRNFHMFDIMLVTSKYEGMPLSVLEGLRAGLPIISTDVCGMNELVKPENGYLVNFCDESGIVDKIHLLSENRIELLNKSKASKKLFQDSFIESKMLAKISYVYRELLS